MHPPTRPLRKWIRTRLAIGWLCAALPTLAGEPARPESYLADFRAALDVKWPQNRTLTVVCHGHSVPAGYFRTPVVDSFHAYPHGLHRALKEKHPHAVINVIVTAIGGEDSLQGAARFARDVLALRPDVVTLDYGLNDRGVGLAAAAAAWQAMITQAQAAGCKVILLTPSPDQRARSDDPADPLAQHTEQIRRLAAAHGVGLADSAAAFARAVAEGAPLPSLMSQVNHPNAAGHQLILDALRPWFLGPP
jgi:lysophospholipase L1-like esterase